MLNAPSVEWAGTTDDTMNLPGNPRRFIYWLLHSHPLAFNCHEIFFSYLFLSCSFLIQLFPAVLHQNQLYLCLCGRWLGQCSVLDWVSWLPLEMFLILPVICDLYLAFWGECVRKLCSTQITELLRRESIRERTMCLDLTSFIHCALPVCLHSSL